VIKRIILLGLSLLLFVSGYTAILLRIEFLQYDFYLFAWWGYIFLLGALPGSKGLRPPGLTMGLISLAFVSSGFWSLFELLNLRMDNWFYVNLPQGLLHRWAGYLFAYGTVIPAILLTAHRIEGAFSGLQAKPFTVKHYPAKAIGAGTVMLALTLVFPRWLFPLAWLFCLPLIDGLSYRMHYRSFMGDVERGEWKAILSSVIAGLVCGFLWEFWNFWSISKWVYSVPGFENWKLFEMPLPGYLGFAFFGLETMAFVRFLEGAVKSLRTVALFVAGGLVLSLIAFPLIDRYTVASCVASIEELTFLNTGTRLRLKMSGVLTSFGIDPSRINEGEEQSLRLLHLKGLGLVKSVRLRDHGITTVRQLARLEESQASAILAEPNLRRVRVYLKAARRQHPQELQ
jgi:hypothetical protein